jgi:glucosamine-6-phosphate deaminase
VPSQAVTCGMKNILAARNKLLLVSGEHKREILRRVMTGRITPETPGAYLRESAGVTVIADVAAWPWPHPPSVTETTIPPHWRA